MRLASLNHETCLTNVGDLNHPLRDFPHSLRLSSLTHETCLTNSETCLTMSETCLTKNRDLPQRLTSVTHKTCLTKSETCLTNSQDLPRSSYRGVVQLLDDGCFETASLARCYLYRDSVLCESAVKVSGVTLTLTLSVT